MLAQALAANTCCTSIDLGGNSIGDGGVALLAASLRSHPGLTELKLTKNSVTRAGAASMAEVL